MKPFLLFTLLSLALPIHFLQAQSVIHTPYYPMQNWDTSPYKSFRFESAQRPGEYINFRMLLPNGYDSSATDAPSYPLLLVLHGAGESARMKWDNGNKTNTPYPEGDPRIDNNDHHLLYGGREHLEAVESGSFPGFVVFPQNSYGSWVEGKGDAASALHRDLQKALELIDYLKKELNVNRSQIYVHGLSNGGAATWYAAYKRPKLFAAALPMSSPGDPAMASELAQLRLWVFQGADDTNPRAADTRQTIEAIRQTGGSVRYTEYAETGHNTWEKAYREPDFFEWMLSQQQEQPENQAPSVNAGGKQTIYLPVNKTSFTATATDQDGSIASWFWEQLSGPTAKMEGTEDSTLELEELEAGTYLFRITVTDNRGARATDQASLEVLLPSGIEQEEISSLIQLKAYPNPFREKIKLQMESVQQEAVVVSILNSYGTIIFQEETFTGFPGDEAFRIDLSGQHFPHGLYFIHVRDKNGRYKKILPLIKQ